MSNEIVEALEKIARELTGAKRRELRPEFDLVSSSLGLSTDETKHLSWPLPSWPKRGEAARAKDDALRYAIDFGHGDQPDHRDFVATFEQVRKLLNYTRDSCKVAFGTGRGKVERLKRPTSLGPCVITRLPHPIELKDFPSVLPLQVKVDEAPTKGLQVTVDAAGRKRVVPRHGNKY